MPPRLTGALRAFAFIVLVCQLGSCSSPTGPTTTPPVTTPPVTPTPPDPRPALTITCPVSPTVAATTSNGVNVTFSAPVVSGAVEPVNVSCTRQSGSLFDVGITAVQCTATDGASRTSSCTFTVTVNPPPPQLSRTKFLAFGDSITTGEVSFATVSPFGSGPPNFRYAVIPAFAYPTRLASLLRARYTTQASVIDVINAGLPGEWAEDGAARLPGLMTNVRPDALLLMHGYNELATFGDAGPARATRVLDLMAKEGRARGARVFIATLTPPRAGGPKSVSAAVVSAYNDRLRATALGEGAVFVDVYAALVGDIPRYIGVDGLHPTEEGYQRIASTFFDAIRATLEQR